MEFACIDFINSYWYDYRGSGREEDRLRHPGWLSEFVRDWHWPDPGPVDEASLATLTDLRTLLRRLTAQTEVSQALSKADLVALNYFLGLAEVRQQLVVSEESYRLELKPTCQNWPWIASQIAASFVHLLTEHEPQRLKTCENTDCKWVFYDASRNHSQRWCDDSCGNLLKVRRFRSRQQQAKPT